MSEASLPSRRLPPGVHGIPPEVVARNQRERLIAAMAEVCAERGYVDSSVAEVARRAGVSTASFYRRFGDRRECMVASFEELFGRLLEEIRRACDEEPEAAAKAGAAARSAAALLAADPPTARLLSLEILAVGDEGALVQHRAIEQLADLLRAPGGGGGRTDAAWAAAAAIVALVARGAAEGTGPDPEEIAALAALAR